MNSYTQEGCAIPPKLVCFFDTVMQLSKEIHTPKTINFNGRKLQQVRYDNGYGRNGTPVPLFRL